MKPNAVGRAIGQNPIRHPNVMPATKSGFVSGTVLLTQEGEMPVEFICPGDRIVTRDAGLVRLAHISHQRVLSRAISFAAGSLGDMRPDSDLILPAEQIVLVRDWRAKAMFGTKQAMIRADALIDGEFIRDLGVQNMMLHQLHFAAPHVLYAGGLELSCDSNPTCDLRSAA